MLKTTKMKYMGGGDQSVFFNIIATGDILVTVGQQNDVKLNVT